MMNMNQVSDPVEERSHFILIWIITRKRTTLLKNLINLHETFLTLQSKWDCEQLHVLQQMSHKQGE